jgi:hypothetical protein
MNPQSMPVNVICLFTQIMWFYVMGLTTPIQVRTIRSCDGTLIELIR